MGDVVQDTAGEPQTGQEGPRRLVSSPSAPTGKAQHAALSQRVRGHVNSFGVSGNFRSVLRLVEATKRAWYTGLGRRSQRTRLTWERFGDLLQQFPLPRPRITVRIWGG